MGRGAETMGPQYKSTDKYINLTKMTLTNIKICFVCKSSTIVTCHLIVNVWMKLPKQEE